MQDAPGHGGIILMLTVPAAGSLSIVLFLLLSMKFYQVFLDRLGH